MSHLLNITVSGKFAPYIKDEISKNMITDEEIIEDVRGIKVPITWEQCDTPCDNLKYFSRNSIFIDVIIREPNII